MYSKSAVETRSSCASETMRGLTGLVAGATTAVVLAVAFGAMALGVPYFWIVFPVGFGGVLPVAVALAGRYDEAFTGRDGRVLARPSVARGTTDGRRGRSSTGDRDDALRLLRERYVRGELTDDAFERRVERLLETETVADATIWMASGSRTRSPDTRADGRGGDDDEPANEHGTDGSGRV